MDPHEGTDRWRAHRNRGGPLDFQEPSSVRGHFHDSNLSPQGGWFPPWRRVPGEAVTLTLDRFRTSLKFSLWAWALYWPGGGLLLLGGGLDPVSIAVTLGCTAAFVVLLAGGALRTTSSRNVRELFLERPLYLVAGLVFFIAFAALLPALTNAGLAIFSAVWLAAIGLVAWRWAQHVRATGLDLWRSKADQPFLVFALVGIAAVAVFLDAALPLLTGDHSAQLGTPSGAVAAGSWVSLLYPPLVLVASKPFREPLSFRRQPRGRTAKDAVPEVVPAEA